ncbi:DNA-directed RNA polymerase II subunit RPB1-like [Ylistrum balloti]|uniref:DNA-directed RNA polymerase II subunit RPB1-like n=1 Tax=Ylistrum balloti TaxID=509963 RepID=UPI002905D130|nr:DNA-directed RNA polymerase II subunit RPB1-like [Ylistrum balloti]
MRDRYFLSSIFRKFAIARDFVRRSFRRISGRRTRQNKDSASKDTDKDNKKIISSEHISFEYDNSGFRDGDIDDGFGDGDSSKRGYSRQDSEHIDLTPEDQSVISGESVRTKTPPNIVGYIKYLDPRITGRSHSTSPRLDTEHPYTESSQDSNTSGSLYQEMNPGLTPDYGPAYQPDNPTHNDGNSIQLKPNGAQRSEPKQSKTAPRSNHQNDKPPSYDRYIEDIQQRSDDKYRPNVQTSDRSKPDIIPKTPSNSDPRSKDRYNPDRQPVVRYTPQSRSDDRYNTDTHSRPDDRYNTDIQPHTNPEIQPRSDDRYNNRRPVKLDFNADGRNRHPERRTPTREDHPQPGYSQRNPTSPGYSPGNPTSPGYSQRNPTSPGYSQRNPSSPGYSLGNPIPGYDRSFAQQTRSPSQGSPPRDKVMLEGEEPVREINI